MRSYLTLLLLVPCAACGASSLPAVGLHAATAQRTRTQSDGARARVDRHWDWLLFADLSFALGPRAARAPDSIEAGDVATESADVGRAMPPSAADDCRFETLCAWELTQVEDALARLEERESP